MRFDRVSISGLAYAMPPKVLTSAQIEADLASVYDKIGLHAGRLELMTGIKSRRYWPLGFKPSDAAVLAGQQALQMADVDPKSIDVLIHASVCRDFLEPATASVVHERLGLGAHCEMFDLSNACLGVVTSMSLAAKMIESGAIKSALIVAGEIGKPLVDATVEALNQDLNVTRKSIKSSLASLTIGSGGAAVLLQSIDQAPKSPKLLGASARVATEHNQLCQGELGENAQLTMRTDAEALLVAGVKLAAETWADLQKESDSLNTSTTKTITHQVGRAHTKMLYEALGLDESLGYFTYETLGNVGSVSVPMTLALALEAGHIRSGDQVALLGIGSGLSCMMMELKW